MYAKKEDFAQQLFDYVANLCKGQLSTIQTYSNDNKVFDVLGVYEKDLREILKKITNALPDHIYLGKTSNVYNEVSEYIAREYILFQSQEDIKNPYFTEYLTNFIYEVINNINYTYHFYK